MSFSLDEKNQKAIKLLGYSVEELKNHIINHPNWASLSDGDWHIDHIFPIKAFVDYGISDIKIINSLDNLQPLSSRDNLSKNDYYETDKFEEYLQKKFFKIL